MGYFGPELFQFVDLFYPESKTWQTKTNEFQGSFFIYLFISKTKMSTVQSVIQLRTRFFYKKNESMKVIGFRDFFFGGGGSMTS